MGRAALYAAASLAICISLAGCAPAQVNRHASALLESLAPVVNQSSDAYRSAVALHNLRGDYEAVVAYENKEATFNPRNMPELLSEKDIQARLTVLAALQVYSKSLIEITRSTDSPELDSASKSAGSNLAALGDDLAPSIENVMGIAFPSASTTTTTATTVSGSGGSTSSTTSTTASAISPQIRNGISAAVDALGQFLVNRTVAKELPGKIETLDPHVQMFCKTLAGDIQALDDLEQRDYDRILNLEKQFILEDEQPGKNVDPQALRAEIMKLPEIARQQREAREKLAALRDAINDLALTHHALAAAAENNNPESLQDKLKALASVGNKLGKFYSSLPTD